MEARISGARTSGWTRRRYGTAGSGNGSGGGGGVGNKHGRGSGDDGEERIILLL